MPWWAWFGAGVLLGALIAALVLQLLVLLSVEDRTRDLRTDVCQIAVTDHLRLVHCTSGQ